MSLVVYAVEWVVLWVLLGVVAAVLVWLAELLAARWRRPPPTSGEEQP